MFGRISGVRISFGATMAALVLATSAQAVLVAYDPFKTVASGGVRLNGEYDAATDMRQMGAAALGWVGTTGVDGFAVAHAGTTGNFRAEIGQGVSTAVTYEQPGRMQWLGVGNPAPFDRNITRQLNPTPSSSEWWFSTIVNRLNWTGAAADNTYVVGGFTDAAGNGLQVGYDDVAKDGIPELVLRSNNISTVLTTDSVSSSNLFVLVKLEINTAGNDTISIWNNPASLSPAPAPDLVISNQDVFSTLNPFTQSKYQSPGQSGVAYFDEVRLATTFADVTGISPPAGTVGDYDGNLTVGQEDYTDWATNFGGDITTLANVNPAKVGTIVDASDYTIWRDALPGASVAASAAVPEPAAIAIVSLVLGAGVAVRRRK